MIFLGDIIWKKLYNLIVISSLWFYVLSYLNMNEITLKNKFLKIHVSMDTIISNYSKSYANEWKTNVNE